MFAEYRLNRVALHYDFRGRSLGTAELHGAANVIQRLAREFKNVEIDGLLLHILISFKLICLGRPLDIQVVGQGSSSFSSGGRNSGGGRIRRTGAIRRDPRRRSSGGVSKKGGKKLTAEELDKELDEVIAFF